MRGFEILQAARGFRGYSQKDLARLYGRSLRSFQRWESGKVPIPYDDLKGIVEDTLRLKINKIEELNGDGYKKAA